MEDRSLLVVRTAWFLVGLFGFVNAQYLPMESSKISTMQFELPDKEKMCFYEQFHKPIQFVFQYKVLKGGNKDVDASVISPNGKILYKEKKQQSGKFVFETSKGAFSFCFSNEFSTITHKRIFFDMRPEVIERLAGEAGQNLPTVRTTSEASCDNIHESTTNVVAYQREYRLKEAIGRHVAETLNLTVLWWSLSQAFVILLTGFGQVFVLKHFFSVKNNVIDGEEGLPT